MGGNSSKAVFTNIVGKLLTQDIDGSHHDFWDELWKTITSTEEMFELISCEDVRKMIDERPDNVKIIFTQAVAQLYQVVETPYPIYFDQALNCTRILARILPFLIENISLPAVRDLLWSKRFILESNETETVPDGNSSTTGEETKSGKNQTSDEPESEPLAVILVNTLFHLLFLPDFTIEDPSVDFTEKDVNSREFKAALMWAPGVGCIEKTVVTSTQYDSNRVDVLRLMIAVFSDSLYQNADTYDSCASPWLEVATSAEAPYADLVFCSLMNTVLGYDPIGWGIPYGNLMGTDTAKLVMESAVQVLIILLDYGHPMKVEQEENNTLVSNLPFVRPADTEARGFNIFRKYLSEIEAGDQLNFIYRGFTRLLNNTHQSENTYLPFSITRIGIEQELLVLLWKCLEEIPKFMPYVLKHCDITEILVPICYFMLEGRKDPSKVGMMYLCTFTLLKLSGERNFGVALNKPYTLHLPVDVPLFSGNHADLLIIVLHKLIVSGLDKLSALYNCFLTIICNVSPYCKTLSNVSAVKLVNLFQLFVSPRFLYGAEGNHIYVSLLLETLNNIVQYQYEGNANLVYSIIRRKELFEGLANLTLPLAIKGAIDNSKPTATKPSAKPTKVAKGEISSPSEEDFQQILDATPTELISTEAVERRLGTEGEVKDVPTSPNPNYNAEVANPEVDNGHTAAVAPRFTPNDAWLQAVKSELPMHTITRLLKHLVPQIEELSSNGTGIDEQKVIEFIDQTTMVGLLPVPHPIVIRKYQPNRYTSLWFTAFQWGVIFMHNQTIPLFDGKNVKLFIVQST